jgi:hypothetical protein
MTSKSTGGVSFASLNAAKASETPFEFEFLGPDGAGSGVFFQVLGSQAPAVRAVVAKLLNERRFKAAQAAARARTPAQAAAVVDTVEDDVAFNQRGAAARLVGWRGIAEDYTPERGLELCEFNADAVSQIIAASDNVANFTKR